MHTAVNWSIFPAALSVLAACGSPQPASDSNASPGSRDEYRAPTPDELKRALYVAGLSFAVPAGARLAYPQGIDSAVMSLSGPGYDLFFDDYGSFRGPPNSLVAGASSTRSEKNAPHCRFRHWEVKLPATNPTMLLCDPGGKNCRGAPAHAEISTYCTGKAACARVDSILASARFAPRPWPRMPSPDPEFRPRDPICRID